MPNASPELMEWAEYYCPWCYVAAVRLHRIAPEFSGRVKFTTRAFPLEALGGEPAPRDILEQEWWLAAIQEPEAHFAPYPATDWPTTTLPAFDAVWAAKRQGDDVGMDFDLRVRRAFFGEGRNIGNPAVLLDVAREAGLDFARFEHDVALPEARAAILAEGKLGKETFRVRSTPTLTLGDGTRLRLPFSHPTVRERKIVAMSPLPCYGAGCDDAIRELFSRALEPAVAPAQPV